VNILDSPVLWYALSVEAGLFVLLIIGLLAGGALADRRRVRDLRRLGEIQTALVQEEETPGGDSGLRQIVGSLPPRLQIRMLAELMPNLVGRRRAVLSLAVAGTDLAAHAYALCGSRLWWRRQRGLRLLAMLDGPTASLVRLFHDPSRRVRTQAVAWAAHHPTPEGIQALFDMVGDPRRAAQFLVKDALVRIGSPVVPHLVRFLTEETGERLRVGLEIAIALGDARTLQPALAAAVDSTAENRALVAALAGSLGGQDAVERLQAMLGDPDGGVRAASAAGLGAASHWPAAAHVAALLGDSEWVVRSQAAVALGAMGAPGMLMLRTAMSHPDRFARDAAHRVLDLLQAGSRRRAG
jgi:hypothetical protein